MARILFLSVFVLNLFIHTRTHAQTSEILNNHVRSYLSFTYISNSELWRPNLIVISPFNFAKFNFSRPQWGPFPPEPLSLAHYSNVSNFKFDSGKGIHAPHSKNRHLGHYIVKVIEVYEANIGAILRLCARIRIFGAPHRDHYIFIGQPTALLKILESEETRDLKFKLGISLDGAIFREPFVYDEGKVTIAPNFPRLADRYVNIVGKRLVVAAARIPPFTTFDQNGKANGGNIFLFLYYVSLKFNVTMVWDHSARRTGVYKNGHWTGLTGMLHYRRADLAIPMGNIPQRFEILDFLQTHTSGIFFVTRPPEVHVKWQAIVYPLEPLTWAAFFVTYFAVSAVLYFILKVSKEKDPWYHTIFVPYQITISQGFDIKVPGAAKTLAAFWMFFILIIVTGYTSDLVSYFSFPEPEEIPRDFESLDKRKDYRVVFHNDKGTALQYFDSSLPGSVKRVRQRFQMEDDVAKCTQEALLGKRTACVDWDLKIRSADAANLTLPRIFVSMLVESKPVVVLPLGIVFPKHSIYTGTFDFIGKYYRDMGLVDKNTHDVFVNYSIQGKAHMKTQTHTALYQKISAKWAKSQTKVHKFKLQNVAACFGFFVIFLVVSAMAFGIEKAYFRKHIQARFGDVPATYK